MAELQTAAFENLARRADVLFDELTTDSDARTDEYESEFNLCLRRGYRPSQRLHYPSEKGEYLADVFKGKRAVFERSIVDVSLVYKLFEAKLLADRMMLSLTEDAYKLHEGVFKALASYTSERDVRAARQICSIDSPTLVLFGLSHQEIAIRVGQERPVEVHFPYEGYVHDMVEVQLNRKIQKTGVFDRDLAVRSAMEQVARAAFEGEPAPRRNRIAHEYAVKLPLDAIKEYFGYAVRCARFYPNPRVIFESFIASRSLPSVDEIIK